MSTSFSDNRKRKVLEHDVTSGASVGSASQKVLARGGAVGGDNSELRRSVGRMQCGSDAVWSAVQWSYSKVAKTGGTISHGKISRNRFFFHRTLTTKKRRIDRTVQNFCSSFCSLFFSVSLDFFLKHVV